jgi:hypothetical protein
MAHGAAFHENAVEVEWIDETARTDEVKCAREVERVDEMAHAEEVEHRREDEHLQ